MKYHRLIHRRLSVIIMLSAIIAAMTTGCGNTEDNPESSTGVADSAIFDSINFDGMDDLEYGATMRESDDYGITVEFDKRFLEDAELEALVSYYTSIQNQDADLFDACTPDFYMGYYLENVYGGLLDSDAYIAQQYRTFQEQLDGADVTFSRLTVTACTTDETAEDSGISYLKEMCVELEGQDYCDEHWNGCKLLTVEPTLTDGTNELVGGEMNVFIVQLDDSYYICA